MSKSNAAKTEAPVSGTSEGGFGSVFNDGGTSAGGNSEFQTNFGAENTAMGDIFKAGGNGSDEKKKRLIFLSAAGAALVMCVGALMFLMESDPAEEPSVMPVATPAANAALTAPTTTAPAAEEAEDASATDNVEDAPAPNAASSVATNATYAYNEKDGGPVVSATSGATVEVSRKADFSVPYVYGLAKDGKFRIPNPPPGSIYWREKGSATAHQITVTAPETLSLSLTAPGSVAAGESLTWSAKGNAAFFRVEFASDPNFEHVAHVLATSKTSVAVKDVAAGKYHVRLAGFNTAAGRWDYSHPSSIEVK